MHAMYKKNLIWPFNSCYIVYNGVSNRPTDYTITFFHIPQLLALYDWLELATESKKSVKAAPASKTKEPSTENKKSTRRFQRGRVSRKHWVQNVFVLCNYVLSTAPICGARCAVLLRSACVLWLRWCPIAACRSFEMLIQPRTVERVVAPVKASTFTSFSCL